MPADCDLLEIALPLRPRCAGPAPPGLGTTAHGLFFALLADAEPGLADRLHQLPNERRPFTVSALLDATGEPLARVDPRSYCWLRITLLTREWATRWREQLAPRLPVGQWLHLAPRSVPHLAGRLCGWDYARLADGPPAWQRQARYAELVQAAPAQRWRVWLVTPTMFQAAQAPTQRRSGGPTSSQRPIQVELLRGLAVAWEKWAPDELKALAMDRERVLALAARVRLEQPRLRQTAGIAGRVGLVGDFVLACDTAGSGAVDRSALVAPERLFSALLRFASYAGVGVQTARGMGLVRAEPL